MSIRTGEHSGSRHIAHWISNAVLFLLVMEMLPPQGISEVSPALSRVLWPQMGRKLAMGMIITAATFQIAAAPKFRKEDYMPLIMGMLYPLTAGLLTYIQGLEMASWWNNYSSIIIALGVLLICKSDYVRLVKVMKLYLEILIIINFLCILAYPTGMYEAPVYKQYNWMLGYKSSLQCYLFPCMCLEWLDYDYMKRQQRFAVMLSIGVAETFLSRNAMLTVGMFIFVLFIIFNLPKRRMLQNVGVYFGVVILENILMVTSNVLLFHSQQFSQLLLLLGKEGTIGSRATVIWPRALRMIADKPIFGHGVCSDKEYVRLFGFRQAVHAHNQILQVLLDGGIVLLAVFVAWIVYTGYKLSKERDRRSSQVLLVSFFLIFFMASVEVFIYQKSYFAYWLILFMAMYTKRIDEQYEEYAEKTRQKRKPLCLVFSMGDVRRKWRFR